MKRSLKSSIKSLNILGILLAFLVLCVIMAIASPAFLKQTNLLNILQQISINFTIAIGMTFVILIGGIDLSVGSITALTGMFVAIMMKNWNIPVAPAIIIAVLSASLLGLINGVLISGLDLPPFIVTLGMMELARGMSYTVTAGQPIYTLPAGFLAISGRVRGIPLVALLIMIALFVLAYYVLHFTRIGRYVYAVGGNESCARLSGINVKAIKLIVYTFSGFCCGIAALLLTSRLDSAVPTNAEGYENERDRGCRHRRYVHERRRGQPDRHGHRHDAHRCHCQRHEPAADPDRSAAYGHRQHHCHRRHCRCAP